MRIQMLKTLLNLFKKQPAVKVPEPVVPVPEVKKRSGRKPKAAPTLSLAPAPATKKTTAKTAVKTTVKTTAKTASTKPATKMVAAKPSAVAKTTRKKV